MIKTAYRKWALATRKAWSERDWKKKNQLIYLHADSIFEKLQANKLILSFQSIEKQREVAMEPIHAYLKMHTLAFPRVHKDQLAAYVKGPTTQFELSTWGILEPTPRSSKSVDPERIEVVLVPLLVVDINGNRVGYGKGMYDRFLALCNPSCLKIGLSLLDPVDPIEDIEPHDIPVDLAISPSGIHFFDGYYRKKPFESTR
jgi:5-formyltetrahydrofolate cyclo-ligase